MRLRFIKRTTPSLTVAVYGFVLISAFVASGIMLFGIRSETQKYEYTVQSSALLMRATALERSLAEALEREWASLIRVAEVLTAAGADEALRTLDTVVGNGIVSWAGFAESDGWISVASGGNSQQTDASAHEWFRNGLSSAYVADGAEAEPTLYLAHPVAGRDGGPIGVLAYHIDADWPLRTLEQKANELDLDVFLLTSDGRLRLRTGNPIDAPLHAVAMAAGVPPMPLLENDAGGNSFLTTVRNLSLTNMPPLAWHLVIRISGQTPGDARAVLTAGMTTLLAALFAEVMLATYAFIRIFIHPLRDLASNAKAIADGGGIPPNRSASSSEVAQLSSALSQLHEDHPGNVAAPVPDFLSLVTQRAGQGRSKQTS